MIRRPTDRFFAPLLDRPRIVLAAALLVVLGAAVHLPGIVKDARSDAFIPPGHVSLEVRDRVKETFGLADPLVIAVEAAPGRDVFTPETLGLVAWLTGELEALPGVDGAGVTSLATESDIRGTEEGMYVEPFFEYAPETAEAAAAVREAVLDFPLYVGSLVAEDGRATLLVAELDDDRPAGDTYAEVVALAERAPLRAGETIHVAGEGGVTGHLGSYIDADVRRMVPLAFVAITVMLALAYRTPRSVVLPNLVIVGGAAVALGSMAAAGVPYYLITTALPVILVAIGVADGVHILGHYYRAAADHPAASQRELVLRSLHETWRPVVITSLTDVAGFLGLAFSSGMPPLRWFGIFASLGVLVTMLLSLSALPAALMLVRRRESPVVRPSDDGIHRDDALSRGLAALGAAVARWPGVVLAAAALVVVVGAWSATRVRIDYERVRNFRAEEPIRIADEALNRHFDGINYLDVMIETDREKGLQDPELLARIDALQRFLESLPHVGGTTSIVDYVKQMSRGLHADDDAYYRIPESRAAVAQTLLLYEMEGDASQLSRSVDYEYRSANVRASLDTGRFSDERRVVEATERYLAEHFADDDLRASLAGRVNVDYHWMRGIAEAHFTSIAIALLAVMLVASLLFGSPAAGLLTAAPVGVAVLGIYAVMGGLSLWLGITTSMFAAIAIGLGVDFSVHLLERLRALVRDDGLDLEGALAALFPSTGRELVCNFACAGLGFGVLACSRVPTLVEFGLLTGVAVAGSFLASMTLIPALACVLRPAFVIGEQAEPEVRAAAAEPQAAA